jgi:hypothetical protein
MNITSYDDLLKAARQQPEPQRLLFVFAVAETANGMPAQEEGTLSPVMCVDKLPGELGSFSNLVEESRQAGLGWDIVFIAGMSGRAGIAPNSDEAEQPLLMMVEAIKNGNIDRFLAFDLRGEIVSISPQTRTPVN